jgi:hypothetical protein
MGISNTATIELSNYSDPLSQKVRQTLYTLLVTSRQSPTTDSSSRTQDVTSSSSSLANLAKVLVSAIVAKSTPELTIATRAPWELETHALAQRHADFSILLGRLKALLSVEDQDEYCDIPTTYALNQAIALLFATFSERCFEPLLEYDAPFPIAAFAADEDGGIHIYWRSTRRNVHVTIPGDETGAAFLYHSTPDDYKVEKPLTPELLNTWLTWYSNA